ncbi:MAG: hypothetical protein KDD48_09410, partial [Bdellovibrionales bacterium]|nr:hypothetical protein [Bdellovibrionales bacterium]
QSEYWQKTLRNLKCEHVNLHVAVLGGSPPNKSELVIYFYLYGLAYCPLNIQETITAQLGPRP